jgi:hypothetical protein
VIFKSLEIWRFGVTGLLSAESHKLRVAVGIYLLWCVNDAFTTRISRVCGLVGQGCAESLSKLMSRLLDGRGGRD